MDDKIKSLANILDNTKNLVVFTGAGISVPSNIPDFRSQNGLYNQKTKINVSPEEIISHSFFLAHTKDFFDFYGKYMVYRDAKYNKAHKFFSDLESKMNVTIVTQNIDGLHQMASSSNVLELHGSIHRNYCMKCHKFYSLDDIDFKEIPICSCGGVIKPDVVLYEEGLDENVIDEALKQISNADTMIIVGTSLAVYPAASFVKYFRGKNLIVINKSVTPMDSSANLVFNDDIINVVVSLEK